MALLAISTMLLMFWSVVSFLDSRFDLTEIGILLVLFLIQVLLIHGLRMLKK